MLLKTIDARSIDLEGKVKYDVSNAMRSTDSEAGAIYILQQRYIIDNIRLLAKVENVSKVGLWWGF